MRRFAFFAPLAAVTLVAGAAAAQSPDVSVVLGPDLIEKAEELGERDLLQQADQLAVTVERALAREQALPGATISLVLVDIRPNRPTFAQLAAQPGLDGMRSKSIGGATIEGEVTLADGTRYPVRYDWYSSNLAEVRGFTTWQDASHAFDRFARRLATGRLAG
ncbi:MAG: hypothetical protein KKF88_13280 [Alphaproteobacteria bacterium]|nr:hypothetical protein [Alphaproteobacteria bacterium]